MSDMRKLNIKCQELMFDEGANTSGCSQLGEFDEVKLLE